MVACQAHNLEVPGSSPGPATAKNAQTHLAACPEEIHNSFSGQAFERATR